MTRIPTQRPHSLTNITAAIFIILLALSLLPSPSLAHEDDPHPIAAASADMAKAAQYFLASLTPEQRAQALFNLNDAERFNWYFVPRIRKGLTIKAMTPPQRNLAYALLASGLSQRGYVSAATIMSLEQVLAEMQQGRGPVRDAELYYVSIFGRPGPTEAWGWRFEGHHLSINFTLVGGRAIASAPAFMGSNPAEVKTGPRVGTRIFDKEEDLARALVKSMTDEQRRKAIIFDQPPREIVTSNVRKVATTRPVGIAFNDLTDPQRKLLQTLIEVYARRLRSEVADQTLAHVNKVGLEKIRFGWSGGMEKGQPHYYRIHGPTFLVEYDDTQDAANHVHTVWRDLEHDFGEDLLDEHYRQQHNGGGR